MNNIYDLLATYPRKRNDLPEEYKLIYDKHYNENRKGKTKASSMSSKLERWLHNKVAISADKNKATLEIGAGTLNQLNFEKASLIYDIVEPYKKLYENEENLKLIRNVYSDISEIKEINKYDRITSIACFEHIGNLPEVVEKAIKLLNKNGKLYISIPNEGRFLWKFAYTMTTGREFKKRFGLKYETLMRYEHINNADEIECILKYYFGTVKRSMLGITKPFSFYRFYECSNPKNNLM